MEDRALLAAAQARSFAIAAEWRASDAHRTLTEAFDSVSPDDVEAVAGIALHILGRPEMVTALFDRLMTALRDDPWFEPPFRVSRDRLRVGAALFDHPAAAISATMMSAAAWGEMPPPASIAVSGRLALVRYVRGGGARLRLWTAEPAGPDFSGAQARPVEPLGTVALADGMILRIDGRTRATLTEGATSDVVTITVTIRAGAAPYQREYALPDGEFVRMATLDDGAARTQMLLTFLRHAKRVDAAPWFEAATRDGAFFLRWSAMREWLALDARGALPRLRAMTDDPNMEVRTAAAAMLPMVEAACRS
jgi:hypothetical protein